MHSEAALDPAESTWGDTVKALAGPGAPGILEFSVLEFAAALGMFSDWGAAYLGAAIELRHRLPRVWARVMAGDLQAWHARRIAEATLWLSPAAAAHVDRHLAPVAHQIRPTALDRLVEEAATRHDPDQLARRTEAATDRRGVHLDTSRTSLAGTVPLHGELDLPDALTLDEALAHGAAGLATLGSTESLDARRGTSVARGRGASPPGDGSARGPRPGSHTTDLGTPRRAAGPGRHHPHPRHRRDHPHLVRHRRPPGHQARHRPQPADPRRRLGGPRPHPRTRRPARPHLHLPLVHPTRRTLRHRPRPAVRTPADRRRPTTPRPCADDTTAPRPTPAGTSPCPPPAPACGAHPTASTCSATTPAPRLLSDPPGRPGHT
ncbi:DUF222 domain-containing protein [Nocardioides taihuensis]|uniref:DUF222 domain-containing protein n=1 Tax=Nocardioides taihuensis TaxID=1835606 RepID=A0ABW0BHD4_9ACTN